MAFVGISKKFIDDVQKNIDRMHEKELAATPKSDLDINGDDNWFVDNCWKGAHEHLRYEIPKQWKSSVNWGAHFLLILSNGESVRVDPKILDTITGLPPGFDRYIPAFTLTAQDVSESGNAALQARLEFLEAKYEIDARWTKVKTDVVQFLGACKSLNEALKLWPELETYIPKTYVDRVLEKVTRTKTVSTAADVLSGIDTESVRAAAVIARMSMAA